MSYKMLSDLVDGVVICAEEPIGLVIKRDSEWFHVTSIAEDCFRHGPESELDVELLTPEQTVRAIEVGMHDPKKPAPAEWKGASAYRYVIKGVD